MLQPPPDSTPCPYTTLFRCHRREHGDHHRHHAEQQPQLGHRRPQERTLGRRVEGQRQEPERPADRKSTRLNSSHANISYAVFCLKTKISYLQYISTTAHSYD